MNKGFDISTLKKEKTVRATTAKSEGGTFDFLNKDISLGGDSFSDKKRESFIIPDTIFDC